MKILLVTMPWQSLDFGCLAIGILRETAKRCRRTHEVRELYGNLRWAEFLLDRSDGKRTPEDYNEIADNGIFDGVGDWTFAPALYDTDDWRLSEYTGYLRAKGIDPTPALEMRRLVRPFIAELADQVAAANYDFVGFSTTFMQNVPSLALARALKQRRPEQIIAFGGGNCDGPMGAALHRNYDFVDFVVRGEGEQAFVDLLDAIDGFGEFRDIEGLCWRADGRHIANPDRYLAFPIEQSPAPNYDHYFSVLGESPVREFVEPKIVLESSRGCWWGEKHQCTFCGLNGSLMKFRSKSPDKVWREIRDASERHRCLDVIMVDNIMDMRYLDTLLPTMAESGWDFRTHYEIKSNLRAPQVGVLSKARVAQVQPGIESLSSRVLRLMNKGVSGVQNVQLLRDGEEHGITVEWNYLYGFPGEAPDDYLSVVEQVPALHHLQPPNAATRIALERFSPNFENPALGFAEWKPAKFYEYVYDLPVAELMDLAYLFDTPDQGISGDVEAAFQRSMKEWRKVHFNSSLMYRIEEGRVVISDARAHWEQAEYILDDEREVAAYLALMKNNSIGGLERALSERGFHVSAGYLESFLRELKRFGLVFEDAGFFAALAVRDDPCQVRLAKAAN